MDRFYEGQDNIETIWDEFDNAKTVDKFGVEKITVTMESGQMSLVPWFCVWMNGTIRHKYNSAKISSVTLKESK